MFEKKWTPGPWTYSTDDKDDNEQLQILGANKEIVVAGCGCCGSPFGDNLKHDAPLLAAAPEMYEALVGLLGLGPSPLGCECDICEKARAALAKARGEEVAQ